MNIVFVFVQSEYVRDRRVSADVIGQNNEDDVRRSSSEVDSLSSPTALLPADRFAHFHTVKPVFFTCLLFLEFCDLGNIVKVTGRKYSKSHAIFSVLLSLASKNSKIKGAKIM